MNYTGPKALTGRVIAKKIYKEAKSASGLIIATKEMKQDFAEIVSIDDTSECKSPVNVGDRVIYKEYSVTEVKVDGVDYIIINHEDLLATL